MEDITELENLNMDKKNLDTETITDSDSVTLVAGEPLESGRAVVVNSSGQVMHAALGISEIDINLAVERLVLPSDDSINMMRYLLPGESYSHITGRSLRVLEIDDLIIDDVASVPRPSRGFSHRRSYQDSSESVQRPSHRPSPKPVSCVGCINYHGQSYGGNKLICAIHPTGVEGYNCGDWEGKSEPNL